MKTGKTRRAAALLLIVALLAGLPVLAGADRRDQNVDLDERGCSYVIVLRFFSIQR